MLFFSYFLFPFRFGTSRSYLFFWRQIQVLCSFGHAKQFHGRIHIVHSILLCIKISGALYHGIGKDALSEPHRAVPIPRVIKPMGEALTIADNLFHTIPSSLLARSIASELPVCLPRSSDNFTTLISPCPKSAETNLMTMFRGLQPTSLLKCVPIPPQG